MGKTGRLETWREALAQRRGGSGSIQTFNWLNETHKWYWKQSALLSLPIQTFTSSRIAGRETSSCPFGDIAGHCDPNNLACKTNHYRTNQFNTYRRREKWDKNVSKRHDGIKRKQTRFICEGVIKRVEAKDSYFVYLQSWFRSSHEIRGS